eukprot:scaffold1378_cov160-Amphora_coffeaeformis.AAC.7
MSDNDNNKYCIAFSHVQAAAARIQGVAHQTPVLTSASLNKLAGDRHVYFKVEALQRTGSFKFRGAYNAIQSVLQEQEKQQQDGNDKKDLLVVTHSSGNHAQALALAALLSSNNNSSSNNSKNEKTTTSTTSPVVVVKVNATIVMPHTTPRVKRQAVQDFGANIVLVEPTNQARQQEADRICKDNTTPGCSTIFIHPSEDPRVIAGQGTVCLEMVQQVRDMRLRLLKAGKKDNDDDKDDEPPLDAVIIPVGGGGLAAGNLISLRALLGEKVKIILAEPAVLDDAKRSFESGQLVGHDPDNNLNSVADGLKTTLGPHTWPIVRDLANTILTVSEREICQATQLIWERLKIAIEPSAGVGVAVLLSEQFQQQFADCRHVGVILCGGNVDIIQMAAKMKEHGL